MKKEVAKEIVALGEEYASDLEKMLTRLREECPREEARLYEDGIAQVLQHLRDDILAPVYREHPDLRPAQAPPSTQ